MGIPSALAKTNIPPMTKNQIEPMRICKAGYGLILSRESHSRKLAIFGTSANTIPPTPTQNAPFISHINPMTNNHKVPLSWDANHQIKFFH